MAGSSGRRRYNEQFDIIAGPLLLVETAPDCSAEAAGGQEVADAGGAGTLAGAAGRAVPCARHVVNERDVAPAHPDDSYLAELDRLVAAHDASQQDRVTPAIAAGSAPPPVVRRVALEAYHAGRWL